MEEIPLQKIETKCSDHVQSLLTRITKQKVLRIKYLHCSAIF